MTKWEYLFIDSRKEHAQALADEHGEDGWELVGAELNGGTYNLVFKRPLQKIY